nr:hypothetical protein [Tanacetum cinerariifolium]
ERDGGGIAQSREDAPIKGRSLDEGEEAAVERGSDDTEEMVTVLTSLDAASILTSGVFISISPVTEVSVAEVPTGSDVEMARQLEEEMARDAQRMNEQIARDAEIARIPAKEEL